MDEDDQVDIIREVSAELCHLVSRVVKEAVNMTFEDGDDVRVEDVDFFAWDVCGKLLDKHAREIALVMILAISAGMTIKDPYALQEALTVGVFRDQLDNYRQAWDSIQGGEL